MKKFTFFIALIFASISSSCSGSDTYQGKWKATDAYGSHSEITFEKNTVKVTDSSGAVSSYGYTQHSVEMNNSQITYGIKADDGNSYQIIFPDSEDETKGLFMDTEGNVLFTIGRKDFIKYDISKYQ